MPERGFDTGFWGKPNTRKLSRDAKTLNAYLFTNNDCLQSGLYYIDIGTIAFFTGVDEETIPSLLEEIETKTKRIKWWQEEGLIWVKNFIKRNKKSATWLKSAAHALEQIDNNEAVRELLDYYLAAFPDIGLELQSFFTGQKADRYTPNSQEEIDIDGLLNKKLKDFCQFYKDRKLGDEPAVGVVTTHVKDALKPV